MYPFDYLVKTGHFSDFIEEIDHQITDYCIVWVLTEEIYFIIVVHILVLNY